MKRFLIVFLFGLYFFPAYSLAQTEAEIQAASKTLRQAGEDFLEIIRGLNEEQWNFKAEGFRHTIGEEAEHVALAENDLQGVVQQAVRLPKNPELAESLSGKEKRIREMMLEPETLAENYTAKGKLKTKAEVLEYFERAHRRAIQFLEQTPELGLHVFRHPHGDYDLLTAYQWYYYIAYHNMRHVKQIKEIMAHPDFPGGARQWRANSSGKSSP